MCYGSHIMTTSRTHASAPFRKTAISVPARLLAQVDAAAKSRGESRSRFIQRLLVEAVRSRRDAGVRRRIDALFSEEPVRRAQLRGAREFEGLLAWDPESW